MVVLKKIKGSTILENLVASVILMTIFILAGNALNNALKTNIDNRSLNFDNDVKKTTYLILNDKLELPQQIENGSSSASFTTSNGQLQIKQSKNNLTTTQLECCITEN